MKSCVIVVIFAGVHMKRPWKSERMNLMMQGEYYRKNVIAGKITSLVTYENRMKSINTGVYNA